MLFTCLFFRLVTRLDIIGDSSIKRNSAFVKRLRNVSKDIEDSLLKELSSLKCSKFLLEIITALLENKWKKLSDIRTAILVSTATKSSVENKSSILVFFLVSFFRLYFLSFVFFIKRDFTYSSILTSGRYVLNYTFRMQNFPLS